MPEGTMAVVKPEMKSYVWLETADGSIQQVEEEVAMYCPVIRHEIHQKSVGSSKLNAIILPERVNPATLGLILDYCRFHQVPGHSSKELKAFDDKFIRLDTKKLCELTSAADSLQLKPLVDLTSRTLARIIEGKTPEEIREIFNLPDDLTEEEKLEPLKNLTYDPRIRLLNRLYARKRKELNEREQKKIIEAEEEHIDDRSVDDLLSFINGGDNGGDKETKGPKTGKRKKKNRRKKPHTKVSSNNEDGDHKEANGVSYTDEEDKADDALLLNSSGPSSDLLDPMSRLDFEDDDIDDELDPAKKEELDREVEDFARRLNSDWPERMKEILSLGQGRRPTPKSISGNGSAKRYTGLQRK